MSSEMEGAGLPGGFPSMPGFGSLEPDDSDLHIRLDELAERHRVGALSDADLERERARLLGEG